MKRAFSVAAVLLLAVDSALSQTSAIQGRPEVLDGRSMVVAGQDVMLADIHVPLPGERCRIGGRTLDCGRLARAGLIDLVIGGEVQCRLLPSGGHRCLSDGYDLAFGLVHAGWAVPSAGAPAHYLGKMQEAQERGRGLWSAQPVTGDAPTMADTLRD